MRSSSLRCSSPTSIAAQPPEHRHHAVFDGALRALLEQLPHHDGWILLRTLQVLRGEARRGTVAEHVNRNHAVSSVRKVEGLPVESGGAAVDAVDGHNAETHLGPGDRVGEASIRAEGPGRGRRVTSRAAECEVSIRRIIPTWAAERSLDAASRAAARLGPRSGRFAHAGGRACKDPSCTCQSSPALAAVKPWGIQQGDTTRGVGPHHTGLCAPTRGEGPPVREERVGHHDDPPGVTAQQPDPSLCVRSHFSGFTQPATTYDVHTG